MLDPGCANIQKCLVMYLYSITYHNDANFWYFLNFDDMGSWDRAPHGGSRLSSSIVNQWTMNCLFYLHNPRVWLIQHKWKPLNEHYQWEPLLATYLVSPTADILHLINKSVKINEVSKWPPEMCCHGDFSRIRATVPFSWGISTRPIRGYHRQLTFSCNLTNSALSNQKQFPLTFN